MCLCFQAEPTFGVEPGCGIKKNSEHFWFFCSIVTEDEIIPCKSDFVSSVCVYYLRAALEVLLIISLLYNLIVEKGFLIFDKD